MDPVFFYLIGGLTAGVLGSFVSARLMGVDRLWALPGRPEPRTLVRPLVQAATLYRATGPAGLIGAAASADHPLLAAALRFIIEGHAAEAIRAELNAELNRMHTADRRCQFVGRLLGQLSPALGITGMAGAMYLALSRLQDPTGSVAGLAVGVMMLMVGGHLIAMFGRRLSKATPKATTAGQITG
ncbi:MAG TPA: MotA/TolQ/ExbB proton channel family protein, partial [Phycisphaerales bacterium]|nr:MotA/TolQ/ExbB proton channel family protein [Phycisphaerales bacterium]